MIINDVWYRSYRMYRTMWRSGIMNVRSDRKRVEEVGARFWRWDG